MQSIGSNCRGWSRACLVQRRRIFGVFGLALLVLAACDRPSGGSANDSLSSVGDSAGGTRPSVGEILAGDRPVGSGWNPSAGLALVLPSPDGAMVSGSLLRPEATELTVSDTTGIGAEIGSGRVDLFSRAGRIGGALLSVASAPTSRSDQECAFWPVAQLALDGGSVAAPWTAAFLADKIVAVPLDSIEGLSARDSSQLAAALTRIVSRLPDDTSSTFRMLPLVVFRAWRTTGIDSGFVVATLVRRLNQEDDPREERVVVVINTPSADQKTWTVAWHERAQGREEELVVAEPLLAFRIAQSNDLHLLFGRDDGVAQSAAVLSRVNGAWRILWESAIAGCS